MSKNKLKTPLLRKLRVTGGTIYTFPSVLEDIGLNINERNNKVSISHYALLNIPTSNTVDKEDNLNVNRFNPTLIPGHKKTYTNMTGNEGSNASTHIAASLQNYVMNMETVLRNHDDYNYSLSETVSERVFWKWLKESGAIRWTYDKASGTFVEEFESIIDDNDSEIKTGYERVVQCVGEVTASANTNNEYGAFDETYISIPSSYGAAQQYFKVKEDKNYQLGKAYPCTEHLEGRLEDDNVVYTINKTFADYFIGNEGDLPSVQYADGTSLLNDHWAVTEGIPFQSQTDSSLYYVTDKPLDELVELGLVEDTLSDINFILNYEKDDIQYKRSVLDGVSLINNLSELRKVYQKRSGDTQTVLDDLSYDKINIDYSIKSRFNFNTVLLYYSIIDKDTGNVLATNLYGVMFLEGPIEIDATANTGFHTKFYIPTIDKVKSGGNAIGTGYSLKVNVKTTSIYDNTDAYILDNTTSDAILTDAFNDILGNIKDTSELLMNSVIINKQIAKNYIDIKEELRHKSTEINSLSQRVNELLGSKLNKLAINEIQAIDKLIVDNIVSETGKLLISIGDTNVLEIDKDGIEAPKMTSVEAIHDNAYERIKIDTDIDWEDLSIQEAQNVIENIIISKADILTDEILEDDETLEEEVIINPKTFNVQNKNNELIQKLIKKDDSEIKKESTNLINYTKFIPFIIKFLQGIDPDYLISIPSLKVAWTPELDDDLTIVLDSDGSVADSPIGGVDGKINLERMTINILSTLASLNVYAYFIPSDDMEDDVSAWIYNKANYNIEYKTIVSGDKLERVKVKDLSRNIKDYILSQSPELTESSELIRATLVTSAYARKTETSYTPYITVNKSKAVGDESVIRIAYTEIVANFSHSGDNIITNEYARVLQKPGLSVSKSQLKFTEIGNEEEDVIVSGSGLIDDVHARKVVKGDTKYPEQESDVTNITEK